MAEDTPPRSFLTEPISLSNLIGGGTSFEINTHFDEAHESYLDELYVESDDDDGEPQIMLSPWTKPFAELKMQMEQLSEFMHKRVVRASKVGGPTVSNNARVCVRYNAYMEGDTAPFDSSYLRGTQFSFYTGRHEVITGLEEAVCTMQVGEEAQFVISYMWLFGEMGCPPRIKKQADGLFIIELVTFNDVGDIDADKEVPEADRNKYSVIIDKVQKIYVKGLDFFKQHQHRNAARAFEKAVDCLNFCQLATEEEQAKQQEFLIKLNTNLTVCYNANKEPRKTCIVVKELRRLTNNKLSCKALFHEGRALMNLGSYKQANQVLKQALAIEPNNESVIKELKILNDTYKRDIEETRRFARKAFGLDENEGTQKDVLVVSKGMEDLNNLIEMFNKKSNMLELDLPTGLTREEVVLVESLAKMSDLKIEVIHGDQVYHKLSKRNKPQSLNPFKK